MSGLARRVRRAATYRINGFDIRRRIARVRKASGLGRVATTLAQVAIERRLFARKPTARMRDHRPVRK